MILLELDAKCFFGYSEFVKFGEHHFGEYPVKLILHGVGESLLYGSSVSLIVDFHSSLIARIP